jgi:hypothetical protein
MRRANWTRLDFLSSFLLVLDAVPTALTGTVAALEGAFGQGAWIATWIEILAIRIAIRD